MVKQITQREHDFNAIAMLLNCKEEYKVDFTVEIIWSAMTYLKEKPESPVALAIHYGINEWIK
jgi:hypothetical protein